MLCPSLAILLTFTLQSQLFKAACTSTSCQPASRSCEKWVTEFKGAHSGKCTAACEAAAARCVYRTASCSEIYMALWEFESVYHQRTFMRFYACTSVFLSAASTSWPTFVHDSPQEPRQTSALIYALLAQLLLLLAVWPPGRLPPLCFQRAHQTAG